MAHVLKRAAFTDGVDSLSGLVLARLRLSWYATSAYAFLLRGKHPLRLKAAPEDPRPGLVERGAAIIAGHLDYAGHVTPCRHVDAFQLAETAPQAHRRALHSFRWLRDLAAVADRDRASAVAERMMRDWLGRYGSFHAYAWRPDILGERLIFWTLHAPLILSANDPVYRSLVLSRMGRQTRHLANALAKGHNPAGKPRIFALAGLAVAGAVLPGYEHFSEWALAELDRTLPRFVLSDGGVASRSPEDALKVLQLLKLLRAVLTSLLIPVPSGMKMAIEKLVPFIRAMRMGDGGFAGMGGTFADRREDVEAALSGEPSCDVPFAFNETGYHRLEMRRTVALFDAGPPAGGSLMADAQAGTLCFELSDGASRIVVNMGGTADAWGGHPGELSEIARTTAAHSTLVLEDTNSTQVMALGGLGNGVETVTAERLDADGRIVVIASHDGYVRRFGFEHVRRLTLAKAGAHLDGEDILEPSGRWWERLLKRRSREAVLRFHLHPTVTATPTRAGDGVLLRLDNGRGWLFRIERGQAALEESLYVPRPGKARKSLQIVVALPVERNGLRVRWAFAKAERGA